MERESSGRECYARKASIAATVSLRLQPVCLMIAKPRGIRLFALEGVAPVVFLAFEFQDPPIRL